MIDYLIDVGRDHDQGYIRSSWIETYWHRNGQHKGVRRGVYVRGQKARIKHILRNANILVARPPDWPEGILGYTVTTPGALHWWCVKPTYRAYGVGRALLHSALEALGMDDPGPKGAGELAERNPKQAIVYTHDRYPFTQALWRRGIVYDPYEVERIAA